MLIVRTPTKVLRKTLKLLSETLDKDLSELIRANPP